LLKTNHTPAERLSQEDIDRQVKIFENNKVLEEFLSKIPAIFFIVNKYRQTPHFLHYY